MLAGCKRIYRVKVFQGCVLFLLVQAAEEESSLFLFLFAGVFRVLHDSSSDKAKTRVIRASGKWLLHETMFKGILLQCF